MATRNGAAALMLEKAGSIKEEYVADLTIIDTRKPHLTPLHDPFTLPFFTSGEDVSEVIIDGKLIMKNREVTTLDEDTIIKEATEIVPLVRERIQKILQRSQNTMSTI